MELQKNDDAARKSLIGFLRTISTLASIALFSIIGYNTLVGILKLPDYTGLQRIYISIVFTMGTLMISMTIINLLFKLLTDDPFKFRSKWHNRKTD